MTVFGADERAGLLALASKLSFSALAERMRFWTLELWCAVEVSRRGMPPYFSFVANHRIDAVLA